MKEKILSIIETEFANLLNAIKDDFNKNYCKKKNNFLLRGLDNKTVMGLVFASSYESKIGNAMQKIALQIARLKYGKKNVPAFINIGNLEHNFEEKENKQYIITKVNTESKKLIEKIAGFIQENQGNLRCKPNKPCSLSFSNINNLLEDLPLSTEVEQMDIDLAFFDGHNWNIFEIKAGGDLDSSNAKGNVMKLLTAFIAMDSTSVKPYFATYYNKDGDGNVWNGSMKKFLKYPDMFLIGAEFWEKILPSEISFNEFKDIYLQAMNNIKIQDVIDNLSNLCEE